MNHHHIYSFIRITYTKQHKIIKQDADILNTNDACKTNYPEIKYVKDKGI
jgi:hypothetical protein